MLFPRRVVRPGETAPARAIRLALLLLMQHPRAGDREWREGQWRECILAVHHETTRVGPRFAWLRAHHGGDEELRAVGVGASVRHREQPGLRVLHLKVLIREPARGYTCNDHTTDGNALSRTPLSPSTPQSWRCGTQLPRLAEPATGERAQRSQRRTRPALVATELVMNVPTLCAAGHGGPASSLAVLLRRGTGTHLGPYIDSPPRPSRSVKSPPCTIKPLTIRWMGHLPCEKAACQSAAIAATADMALVRGCSRGQRVGLRPTRRRRGSTRPGPALAAPLEVQRLLGPLPGALLTRAQSAAHGTRTGAQQFIRSVRATGFCPQPLPRGHRSACKQDGGGAAPPLPGASRASEGKRSPVLEGDKGCVFKGHSAGWRTGSFRPCGARHLNTAR